MAIAKKTKRELTRLERRLSLNLATFQWARIEARVWLLLKTQH